MKSLFFYILTLMIMASEMNAQDSQQSSTHFWHTTKTSADATSIWRIWCDVNSWKSWDSGLKNAVMDEEFALGAKGLITSREGRKSKFKVVEFRPNKSYTFKTNLPLGGLFVKRELLIENGQTLFKHEVWFSGITKGIFARAFGGDFKAMLPAVMENIKKIAEQ